MTHEDDYFRTIPYGENALSLIKRNRVSAFPRNYEFWYTYAAAFNSGLNKAVNELIRNNGCVTAVDIDRFYEEFFPRPRLDERIDDVGNQITNEISQVVDIIEASLTEADSYQNTLNRANQKLSGSPNMAHVREIVRDLVVANHENAHVNKSLLKQLDESKRQINDLQSNLEIIRFESLTDELTTLANRKYFDRSIVHATTEAVKNDEPLALLLTDIDHFKRFNDTFGHQTGDHVLRIVALAVKQTVKGQDIPCRYGGEEFAIILPKTHLRQAVTVAEHMRKSVMSKDLVKRSTGEKLGRITISVGVGVYRSDETVTDFIERTDSYLYRAKRAGRNKVLCETDPEITDRNKKIA